MRARPAPSASASSPRREKGALVEQLGAKGFIDRNEFAGHDAPRRRDARGGEGALRASRASSPSASRSVLGDAPDVVFEHVGKATFPTSVFIVKPFGKVVICGATSGYDLDFDVRYLWMRQKQIIGSHFANAWECNLANELIEESKVRPVLWRTMGFDQVAEAHQLMHENKHLGQDRHPRRRHRRGPGPHGRRPRRHPRGGRRLMAGVVHIPWYATGFRHDKLAAALAGIAPIALRYGARSLRRSTASATTSTSSCRSAEFDDKLDFERYWHGPEFTDFRVLRSSWYQVPVLYALERPRGGGHARARGAVHARTAGGAAPSRAAASRADAGLAARRSATGARASARCPSACAPATGG